MRFPPRLIPILVSSSTRPSLLVFRRQLHPYTIRMSSKITPVSTKEAPAAMAVYSQAIVANGFVYCSGKLSLGKS